MKFIKVIQIILFLLLVGYTGTWTNGEITDVRYIIDALVIVGLMVFLHIIKVTVKEAKRKKKYKKYKFVEQLYNARVIR